jgi:ABC-type uncharacterized transport system substrate-binding protein
LLTGQISFDLFRQAGTMVGKVLGGTTPANLPIERPASRSATAARQ